jgi:hypothetical protein
MPRWSVDIQGWWSSLYAFISACSDHLHMAESRHGFDGLSRKGVAIASCEETPTGPMLLSPDLALRMCLPDLSADLCTKKCGGRLLSIQRG